MVCSFSRQDKVRGNMNKFIASNYAFFPRKTSRDKGKGDMTKSFRVFGLDLHTFNVKLRLATPIDQNPPWPLDTPHHGASLHTSRHICIGLSNMMQNTIVFRLFRFHDTQRQPASADRGISISQLIKCLVLLLTQPIALMTPSLIRPISDCRMSVSMEASSKRSWEFC